MLSRNCPGRFWERFRYIDDLMLLNSGTHAASRLPGRLATKKYFLIVRKFVEQERIRYRFSYEDEIKTRFMKGC